MISHLTQSALAAAEGTDPQQLGGVAGWAVDLMDRLGPLGVGLAIGAENLFPPLPSEIILPLAGFTASRGEMSFAAALAGATAGSVVGALVLYYLGVLFGRQRLHALWAKLPLVKMQDLHRTEAWFAKHGRKTVFFGRMIPIFRSLISIPAGIERMPVGIFTLLTTVGSLIWNTIFITAGFYLGENWAKVEGYAGVFQKIVIVLVAVAVLAWIAKRVIDRRRGAVRPGSAREENAIPADDQLPGV